MLGDAPYYPWEELQYRLVLQALDANELSFVVHVGDIFWHPCHDWNYQKTLDTFNRLRHPLIYTPGDNEWTDCWEPDSGRFKPLERHERIRQIFFSDPAHSLGGNKLLLASQAGREPFSEFVEHARWVQQGIVFATVHLVGSLNAQKQFPGRTSDDDEASRRRTEAAAAWARETFAEAKALKASAVVLAFQASPSWEEPIDHPERRCFEPFITVLEEEVERFPGPVLVMHGDNHVYTVDHPLLRRTTGHRLENLTRLEVPGSPRVGWVRVMVTPGAKNPFDFEEHVIPRWKYW